MSSHLFSTRKMKYLTPYCNFFFFFLGENKENAYICNKITIIYYKESENLGQRKNFQEDFMMRWRIITTTVPTP